MSNGRNWTPDDTATLRRLVAAGLTDSQIGEHMDRHPETIRQKRHAAGLVRGQSAIYTAMMARINWRRLART